MRVLFAFLFSVGLCVAACTNGGPPCLVSAKCSTAAGECDTVPVDTTGAKSIWVSFACYQQDCSTATLFSTPSIPFNCTPNIPATGSGAVANHMLCVKLSPVVNSSQSVSLVGCTICTIWVAAFSGGSVMDGTIISSASSGTTTSQQAGPITTHSNNQLIVAGLGAYCPSQCSYMGVPQTIGIDSSFVIIESTGNQALVDGGIAFRVLASPGTVNPAWLTDPGDQFGGGAIATIAAVMPPASASAIKHSSKEE